MSGHSKWSTIKRKKGAADSKRSKVWTKVVKEITIAARLGGGDPAGNPRLRRALDLARSVNMPAENLARAVKKGTGELEGVAYDEIVYEASGAAGCFFVIEILTDNRNRTAAEMRRIFEKNGGTLGTSGSSTWAFTQRGVIRIAASSATEETLFEVAVGAGADDVQLDEDQWVVMTRREDLDVIRDAVERAGIAIVQSGLAYVPNNPREVGGDDATALMALYEAIDDHDDTQNVYVDFELSDESMAALG